MRQRVKRNRLISLNLLLGQTLRDRSHETAHEILDALDDPANPSRRLARAKGLVEEIKAFSETNSDKMPAPVATSLIEEVLEAVPVDLKRLASKLGRLSHDGKIEDRKWPLDNLLNVTNAFDLFDIMTAWRFRRPKFSAYASTEKGLDRYNVPRALVHDLGIRRFATLNYDFELERETMLPERRIFSRAGPSSPFDALAELRRNGESDYFSWNLGSGRIRRVLPNGTTIESDIRNRERVDRMLEFGIGADDVDFHAIHLHGRACTPSSMIVSRRDYNRLYRNNDLHRLPFEHASRMLFGGNPVLFLGMGMTEAEVNQELEQFISTNPYRRAAPIFLLWNTDGGAMDVKTRRMRRLDWLNRLGVLAIFDSDLIDLSPSLPGARVSQFAFARRNRTKADDDRQAELERDIAALRKIATPKLATRATAKKITEYEAELKVLPPKDDTDRLLCEDMVSMLRALPETAEIFLKREEYIPEASHWRSIEKVVPLDAAACLWRSNFPKGFDDLFSLGGKHFLYDEQAVTVRKFRAARAHKVLIDSDKYLIQVDIQPTGSGRGWNSRLILENPWNGIKQKNRLLINGGFSFDTDSLLHGVENFLKLRRPYFVCERQSRIEFFRSGVLEGGKGTAPLLIVLNGMERFFSTEGIPLSAELDELMQLVSLTRGKNRVRWIISGSQRVRLYFEGINRRGSATSTQQLVHFCERAPANHGAKWPDVVPALQMAMTQQAIGYELRDPKARGTRLLPSRENINELRDAEPALARKLSETIGAYRAQMPGAISGDIKEVRKIFYEIIFAPIVQKRLFGDNQELAMECLRAMAFLGTPSEVDVLVHVPRIYEHCSVRGYKDLSTRRSKLCDLLGLMHELGLVIKIEGFPYRPATPLSGQPERFAIHRSMMAEIRASFGIPLSEAKLSTAFNMSLYVAQPIDGYVPEPEVHEELGSLIDRLIGGYKDSGSGRTGHHYGETIAGPIDPKVDLAVDAAFKKLDPIRARQDEMDGRFGRRECFHRMCLAAHVQRLRAALAVIRGYYSTTGLLTLDADDRLASPDRNGVLLEHVERLDTLIDGFGKQAVAREVLRKALGDALFKDFFGCAEPFYPDELIWLHNERGVVMLAMGDLYEARRSFNLALEINRHFVEYDHRGHNWRRIRLNQLTVDFESAELDLVSRKIEEIEAHSQGIQKIGLLREDELAHAVCKGYSGFIHHMRGHRERATDLYSEAIASLDKLHELRAQVYFGRLRAQVITFGKSAEKRLHELDRVHDLALSGRQMDLAYRIQIQKAETIFQSSTIAPRDRRRAIRMLDDAVRYALHTDTWRVRCEALGAMAQARYLSGDHEGALSNVSDALTVAVRYGLEIRKMTLRSTFARILAARGHPLTAEQLARTSINAASRQKIQYAIDHAEATLQAIPRQSALSGAENLSGRRDF